MSALAADARRLLAFAAQECCFSRRNLPIEDIAAQIGMPNSRLDALLHELTAAGLWAYTFTPRSGYITAAGVAALAPHQVRAA